ncbi:hypothetical protein [Pseudoduganella albidiflava]|uniref:Uncharacterized protein n=1 Tax=Pseudoduganella albidiflava TaxID=321983 RepID=A0A411WXL4_9BURK|nr:hypothetical protein [Pseudoduganella albidiflava]QBI01434.1 hypothetical protein EYF70_11660 [Pseudoduganella albidiflava]GGY35711.1 hypothetical protein GCM10007387_17370 [Pseudoduganella albidiflava]
MLEFVLYVFMELFLYNLGRVVIWMLSLGRVRAENLKEAFAIGKRDHVMHGSPAVVPAAASQLVGGLVFTLILMGLFALYR